MIHGILNGLRMGNYFPYLIIHKKKTTTIELKPRKPIMFTANSSKNTQGFCQPTEESIYTR